MSESLPLGLYKPLFEELLVNLQDNNWRIRARAAFLLGRSGDQRAFDPLLEALSDPVSAVRGYATWSLGVLDGERAFEIIMSQLEEHYNDIAATTLGRQIGDRRAVPLLCKALTDKQFSANHHPGEVLAMRLRSAESLGLLGDRRAIEPLIEVFQGAEESLREAAARALGKIGDPRTVDLLIASLNDPSERVRYSIIKALGEIGDKKAVKPLIDELKKGNSESCFAALALGEIGDNRAFKPLNNAVEGLYGGVYVQSAAAAAIGKLGDERACEPLLNALNHEHTSVRFAAAEGLGYLGDKRALARLEWVKEHDDGMDDLGPVRNAAAYAIQRIKKFQADN